MKFKLGMVEKNCLIRANYRLEEKNNLAKPNCRLKNGLRFVGLGENVFAYQIFSN